MTPEERQAAIDNISAEDLAKIQKVQGKKIKVYPEDLLEAEFVRAFGWASYWDIQNDKITSEKMARMIAANRKLELKELYLNAQASFIGAGSARSKKPSQTFKSMTQKLLKEIEADK